MPAIVRGSRSWEAALAAVAGAGARGLKVLGLLTGPRAPAAVRVDDADRPAAVLAGGDAGFASMWARHIDGARRVLDELPWSGERSFAGIAEPLLTAIVERAPIRWSGPCLQIAVPPGVPERALLERRGAGHGLCTPGPEHAEQILAHWPYGELSDPDDLAYIRRCLEDGPASGWREDGALVSWALCAEDGSLGFLHTLEGHRGRGFGQAVAADLVLRVRAAGRTPYGYVVADNEAPLGILERLGGVRAPERYCWLGTEAVTGSLD